MEDHNKEEEHIHDAHDSHGHGGHGHGSEEPIVLHQEKLLGTMLLAGCLCVITLFGLAQAGDTKLDMKSGKAAYDMVESQKPKNLVINTHAETGKHNTPKVKHKKKGIQMPVTVEQGPTKENEGKDHGHDH